ncbi:TetR/AcrR family transcriptional regulator [Paenibacillus thalictri]|uniref:TetR/AcrR family transcriptional regulator n=1 Tax=Paenibacillus thalictri TaxID=2527873 RepID=A0A4Q9DQ98_9BACL|nr:TetR/AcrR family transcriptional regulator [Paenibacillus thalictri]TBL78573.1 TetR/AcrR family transcriptional regulator [Paenibacillus thalictri]
MDTQTFQMILSTTEQLIKEKGCQKTTLQDIMARTGLSKGAIYHYVKSKDELFGNILKNNMEETNRNFLAAVKEAKSYSVKGPVDAIIGSYANNATGNEILVYLLSQQHNEQIKAILDELHQSTLTQAAEWIRYGQQHGAISAEIDAEALASMFVTFSYGIHMRQLIDKPDQQALLLQQLSGFMTNALKSKIPFEG